MRFALWIVAGSLLFAGCGKKAPDSDSASSSPRAPAASSSSDVSPAADAPGPALKIPATPDAKSAVVKLTPANTRIQFIGTHVGPKPDPRVGTFKEFDGQAVLAADSKSLQSVAVEIQAGSLQAEIGKKLTNHLNNEDFLDTRTFPTVTFKSTRIEKDDQGKTQIVGDLTLHGVTKEVSIPSEVTVDDQGLSLKGELTIDRTEFDMKRMLDGVEKLVAITVTVGKSAEAE